MAFQCVVVTPESQVMDESVQHVIVPAFDGQVGILTNRSPLLVRLGAGALRVDRAAGQRDVFLVDGGVAQMKDNKLTIVTDNAVPAAEIDAATARAALAEAEARVPTDDVTRKQRDHDLRRARAMIQIAENR